MQEYAFHLAKDIYGDSTFNATHGLYWSTMPSPSEMLSSELLTDQQLEQLQTPELARLLKVQRGVAERMYHGNLSWGGQPPLREALGEKTPSLEVFKYLASIVSAAPVHCNSFFSFLHGVFS